jgi:putative molybdopterin biosynthesis protein
MAEQVQELPGDLVEILTSVAPWQHVRSMGEDVVATELVLPEGHVSHRTIVR